MKELGPARDFWEQVHLFDGTMEQKPNFEGIRGADNIGELGT